MLQRAGTLAGLYQALSGLVRQPGGGAGQQDGGDRSFRVQPLVVEVLVRQNRISRPDTGRVHGGTHWITVSGQHRRLPPPARPVL